MKSNKIIWQQNVLNFNVKNPEKSLCCTSIIGVECTASSSRSLTTVMGILNLDLMINHCTWKTCENSLLSENSLSNYIHMDIWLNMYFYVGKTVDWIIFYQKHRNNIIIIIYYNKNIFYVIIITNIINNQINVL